MRYFSVTVKEELTENRQLHKTSFFLGGEFFGTINDCALQ